MENKCAKFGEIWMKNKKINRLFKIWYIALISEEILTFSCSSISWIFLV